MRIAITGALGHIGSQFIHGICPGEYTEVVLLDNLSTQRYCSLFNLPRGVPFRFVEEDICSADLKTLFKRTDVVVHLAAITDATNSFEIADKVEQVNLNGTERVARACVANGCRMAFFSTTSVYGTKGALVDENCPEEELDPQSPYASSKLKAERMLHQLGQSEGLKSVVCRFGTIYGTSIGMRFHTAINKFCWQACVGQPITVWRTALRQKRPYLELKDAIRALDFIIKTDRFDNQVYNVLTTNATVGEIVTLIQDYVSDTCIEYVDTRIMNQLSYEVSCDKFKALGFEFNGSLALGIRESIELLRGIRQTGAA
jgi:UDP-glucose 4-epimerase